MKAIPLTQGESALVDDLDYEKVNTLLWRVEVKKHTKYAVSGHRKTGNFHQMADFILGPPTKEFEWDHIDHDGLNNQRSNLRLGTHSQNQANRRLQSNNSLGYRGVYPSRRGYKAQIKVNNQNIHLGQFDKIEDAAKAYDKAAKKHFGEFASLNFPI